MFYAARWQQSQEPRVVRCVTSREGSWSACATLASALARPRWPARGRERTAWSRDSFRNRKSYSNSLKKAGKNVSHFLKRNYPPRKPERKKNFESSSEIFPKQLSKSYSSTSIRKMKLIASIIALASANYNSHTLPQDVSEFTWADEANRDLFLAQEYVKEYVRYQAPDDEYVPIDDLPIVFLNGIKFRRQGKEPKPDSLERFKKVTRSENGHLTCMDVDKIHKKHKNGSQKEEPAIMLGDIELKPEFVEPLQEIIYPRYNGPDAPFPDAHMGIIEAPEEVEEEEEEVAAPRRTAVQEFNLAEVDPVSGGVVSSEFEEPEEDEATMVQLVGEIPEEQLAPANFEEESMSREEIRLIRLRKKFFEMKNVKIGCCNGQAYNSQKRCCCRRVSFDMDKKFCCAINGCESFKIMNRGSIQDYNDCLSLDGLVVQEYGYQGQRGQPKIFGSGPRG